MGKGGVGKGEAKGEGSGGCGCCWGETEMTAPDPAGMARWPTDIPFLLAVSVKTRPRLALRPASLVWRRRGGKPEMPHPNPRSNPCFAVDRFLGWHGRRGHHGLFSGRLDPVSISQVLLRALFADGFPFAFSYSSSNVVTDVAVAAQPVLFCGLQW